MAAGSPPRWSLAGPGQSLSGRFGYTGRARSGMRAAGRAARSVTAPAAYPRGAVVRTFWWEQVKNFGDLITPVLLPRFGLIPQLVPAAKADLIGVGSLVQHLPEGFEGTLWGSGIIWDTPTELPGATCVALRGELTRDRLGNPEVEALGDPGLILERLLPRAAPRTDVGLVVHYRHAQDEQLMRLAAGFDGTVDVIGAQAAPLAVLRRIAACRAIVTTSLHGLILADSLGIPALWLRMSDELVGGDFKFRDHESVARPQVQRGVDLTDLADLREAVARAVPADDTAIAVAKERLVRSGSRIADVTRHRRLFPPLAVLDGLR